MDSQARGRRSRARMHIVGTDLCRRLDIEGEIVTDEMAILNKAYFFVSGG